MTEASASGVVAWSDTDASGRYHHTAAYRWAENAEHGLYRSVDPQIDVGRFPRRATSAVYEQALAAGDEYLVELAAERVGNSSITYTWTVSGPAGVCVRGEHTVVHVDEQGAPARVPDAIRAQLGAGEGVGIA
jgi:acyl-CoA thioester hydrolase